MNKALLRKNNFIIPAFIPRTRILKTDEANLLKKIRLEALWYDGECFASTYEAEAALPDSFWKNWCSENTNHYAIGLFQADVLIGFTTVDTWDEDPTGKTALFGKSYIRRGWRGMGYAKSLYKARLLSAIKNPAFTSGVVFARKTNTLSQKINERFGATYWTTRPMDWGDHKNDDALWYKVNFLNLYSSAPLPRGVHGMPARASV